MQPENGVDREQRSGGQAIASAIDRYATDRRTSDRRERWRFRVEVVTLGAVIVYATVALCQWQAMLDANKATRKAAEAATQAASAATAANEIAERNAVAALENSRLEQRAWLGIKNMKLVTLEAGKRIEAVTLITNSGKTVAKG